MFAFRIAFFFRSMFLNNTQSSFNVIQPLPRFYTIRFGRRMEIDDDEENREHKMNEVN